ncbi:hypothetical protein GCM10025868_05590 [Angustibacter aerolatus]|uniref:Peptide deformylase n=1 Tax=Angustibacter aerolatus TaxID=1162965 RepID=A0ABQ6JDR5_9ACTN|nr:peptide deformylase [Angustibacter aerolatus]GMA85309.1 hypothetical protein GCM10025868_05590 [Angustibacter aerolatus]
MIDPSAGANGIRQIGDPVLRTRATPVTDFDDRLGRFVDRMFTAMRHANGVGLAANQIGSDMAAFVWEVEGERGVVVNPVVAEPVGRRAARARGLPVGARPHLRHPAPLVRPGHRPGRRRLAGRGRR